MTTASWIHLPKVIFGTSALGNLYTEQPHLTKVEIIRACFEKQTGPVVFDSAGKYGAGLALETLGKILEELEIEPHRVIISNKLGWFRIPLSGSEPTFEPGIWKNIRHDAVQRISYEGMLACFEQGNTLLGHKYIPQFVSIHDPDEYLAAAQSPVDYQERFQDILEGYRALTELKAQGRIRAIGIGAKNWKVIREIYSNINLDWVMFANSLTILNHPQELLKFMEVLHKADIPVINSAVFQAGFLLGGDYYDYRKLSPDSSEHQVLFHWRNQFHRICERHQVKPLTACINFALRAPGVVSIALNTSEPGHVGKNRMAVSDPIPDAFYADMKKCGLIGQHCKFV